MRDMRAWCCPDARLLAANARLLAATARLLAMWIGEDRILTANPDKRIRGVVGIQRHESALVGDSDEAGAQLPCYIKVVSAAPLRLSDRHMKLIPQISI